VDCVSGASYKDYQMLRKVYQICLLVGVKVALSIPENLVSRNRLKIRNVAIYSMNTKKFAKRQFLRSFAEISTVLQSRLRLGGISLTFLDKMVVMQCHMIFFIH
jgi:hypothetical protein